MIVLIYIVAVMIFWDFSAHVIELFGWYDKFTHSKHWWSYYYPHFRWIKSDKGPIERKNWRKFYQRFWVSYWGLAFILTIIYIIFH